MFLFTSVHQCLMSLFKKYLRGMFDVKHVSLLRSLLLISFCECLT